MKPQQPAYVWYYEVDFYVLKYIKMFLIYLYKYIPSEAISLETQESTQALN
jgi:hypothetical protein